MAHFLDCLQRIMRTLPLTKHLMISVSAAEGATKFKMSPFTCIRPFRCSHVYFEGMLPKKQYHVVQLNTSGSFCYDASVFDVSNHV